MMKKLMIVGIVFLFSCSSVPSSTCFNGKIAKPATSGNILFVGGSGPGNYTTIQDAVNASADGDKVFVYQKASPYQENIVINKSISLIGENLQTSIIARDHNHSTILIHHDSVEIVDLNFPFYNSVDGIIHCENSNFIRISGCILIGASDGIEFYKVNNSWITQNSFHQCGMTYTIHLVESNGNTIEENTFWHNVLSGIFIGENSSNNLIDFNNVNISTNSNDNGLEIERNAGGNNSILHNNFLCSVSSDVRSRWYGNYYEHRIGHNARILFLCPKIILPIILIYPVINVDWHPAQKPYDIPI